METFESAAAQVVKEQWFCSYFQIANLINYIISLLAVGIKEKVVASQIPRVASKERTLP
jgi:hypothetical protein